MDGRDLGWWYDPQLHETSLLGTRGGGVGAACGAGVKELLWCSVARWSAFGERRVAISVVLSEDSSIKYMPAVDKQVGDHIGIIRGVWRGSKCQVRCDRCADVAAALSDKVYW